MFEIGFFELIVIFVLALMVLGPERLPRVARTVGRWLGRARQMARNFQYELEREIDLEDLRGQDVAAPVKPATPAPSADAPVPGPDHVETDPAPAPREGGHD